MLVTAAVAGLVTACGSGDTPAKRGEETASPAPEPVATRATASPPPPQPREFTVVATGDILLHERLWTQARRDAGDDGTWDFAPQLESIKPIVGGADLAVCHLETPLAPKGGPYDGYPMFSGPPQIVPALAEAGYTACTTASNHTFDQGAAGIDRTLDYLDDAGIAHAGSARTAEEAAVPTLVEVPTDDDAVTVGLLSYAYGFNGLPYPDGDSWRSNVIDEDAILDEAAAAREQGAEFVILAMHWGSEYVHRPNELQDDLAPRLIESPDIDLVLGHHAHVVQPLEYVDGEWVVYGMGNLMAAHRTPDAPQSEGLLVRFTVTEQPGSVEFATTGAEYLPLLQTDAFPVSVVDVAAALDGGDPGSATTARLETAFDRTTEIVMRRDADEHGLELLDHR